LLNTIDAGLRARAERLACDIQHKVLGGEASARRPDLVIDAPDATDGAGRMRQYEARAIRYWATSL